MAVFDLFITVKIVNIEMKLELGRSLLGGWGRGIQVQFPHLKIENRISRLNFLGVEERQLQLMICQRQRFFFPPQRTKAWIDHLLYVLECPWPKASHRAAALASTLVL